MAPAIQELDLAGCLLPSWGAVVPLADELPCLRTLDLSCARLALPGAGRAESSSSAEPGGGNEEEDGAVPRIRVPACEIFGALRLLVLNRTGVSWAQARAKATGLLTWGLSVWIPALLPDRGRQPPAQILPKILLTAIACQSYR